MSKNKMKKLLISSISIIIFLSLMMVQSLAAGGSFSVSKSSVTLDEGKTTSFTISVTNCEGQFSISSSDSSVATVSSSSEWISNSAEITITAVKAGSATITIEANDVADNSEEPESVTGSKTISVTVNEKESKPKDEEPSENENKGDEEQNQIQEPSFESVEQTVYASSTVNVRSSYSTDSSIVGSLSEGESVKRTGIGDNGWSRVIYNGYVAYISSDYLTTTKPAVPKDDENKNDEEDDKQEDGNKQDEEEEESKNNNLKVLNVTPSGLEPRFDPNTTNYTLHIGSNIDSLTIDAEADDEKAKVEIIGNKDLQIGENNVIIKVTAEDESEKEYNILVIKEEIVQLGLKELIIEGISLTPEFSEEVYEYTINLEEGNDISKLDIKATASRDDANVEIIGNSDFKPGENVITILVTDGEGEEQENVTYQITVKVPNVVQKEELILGLRKGEFYECLAISIALVIVLIILVFVIRKFLKKRKQEDNIYYNGYDRMNNDDNKDINKDTVDASQEIKKLSNDELPKSFQKETETGKEPTTKEISKDEERKNKLDEFTSAVDEDDLYRRKKGKHF